MTIALLSQVALVSTKGWIASHFSKYFDDELRRHVSDLGVSLELFIVFHSTRLERVLSGAYAKNVGQLRPVR